MKTSDHGKMEIQGSRVGNMTCRARPDQGCGRLNLHFLYMAVDEKGRIVKKWMRCDCGHHTKL